MAERLLKRSLAVGAGTAVIASMCFGLAGCGDKPKVIATCGQVQTPWEPVPSNIKAGPLAGALGVSEETVRDGKTGIVTCEPGITPEQITKAKALVTVRYVGGMCIGIGVTEQPQPGEPQPNIIVLCTS